jgi:hypothetical protein
MENNALLSDRQILAISDRFDLSEQQSANSIELAQIKTFSGWIPPVFNITANGGTIIIGNIGSMKVTVTKTVNVNTERIVLTTNFNCTKSNNNYYNYPDQGVPLSINLLDVNGGIIIKWDFAPSFEFSCSDNNTPVFFTKKDYTEDWFDLVSKVQIVNAGIGRFIKCGYNGLA